METTTQVSDREQVRVAIPGSTPKLLREVRPKTRRQSSVEDKIWITRPMTKTRVFGRTRLEPKSLKRSEDIDERGFGWRREAKLCHDKKQPQTNA